MWQRRKAAVGDDPLRASFTGELLDPSNVVNRVATAMTDVGYGWVTSHVFRKTVDTVLDEAAPRSRSSDRSSSACADLLDSEVSGIKPGAL
jgi:integrase